MATATIPSAPSIHAEDVLPVRSRISWGAIAAGSVLALALHLLLALFGGAVGLTAGDRFDGRTIGLAAAAWAVAIAAVSLLAGGFIASQLTVGENKVEGALYGLLVWGVVFAALLWLMASGVRAGFGAVVGVATAAGPLVQNASQANFEDAAVRAGYSRQQIDDLKARAAAVPAEARQAADDPQAKAQADQAAREAADAAARVTWYAFGGTLAAMLAAAAGGYLGAGPTYRLFAVPVRGGEYGGRRPALA